MSKSVGEQTTAVRPKTHGYFPEGAAFTQACLTVAMSCASWKIMSPAKREATHMILHKLQRVVSGDPDHEDHWADIAGYAQLIVEEIRRSAQIEAVAKMDLTADIVKGEGH